MESATATLTGFEARMTGAGWIVLGRTSNGCVLVMFTAGAVVGTGFGTIRIRAVSCFGRCCGEIADEPWRELPFPRSASGFTGNGIGACPEGAGAPGGFGSGCKSGEEMLAEGGAIAGRRNEITGGSGVVSPLEEGAVIFGGSRRTGAGGVRDGRTIRAVSRFVMLAAGAPD